MTQFHNRIRLPLMIGKPQFPETREVYRKSNGKSVTQSIVIRKTYEGVTDYISERLHEKLKIALAHDFLQFEADNYYGRLVQSGDYQINWLELRNYPIAQAKVQVEVTPFDATNSNCQTCDDANQIVCVDDTFPSTLNENTDYTLDVSANDNICCFPVTWTITTFNSDYLSSCTIDSAGVVHIHTKTGLTSINGVDLFTYRATCPNGGYDEADGFANIHGSVPACLAPTSLSSSLITDTTARINFVEPSPLPNHYHYKLYNTVTHVYDQEGDIPTGTTFKVFTGLTPSTDYIVYLRSSCAAGNADADASNYIFTEFTTGINSDTCGSYRVFANDPDKTSGYLGTVTYMDCGGVQREVNLQNHRTITICVEQSSPGVPVVLYGNLAIFITYLSLCGNPI